MRVPGQKFFVPANKRIEGMARSIVSVIVHKYRENGTVPAAMSGLGSTSDLLLLQAQVQDRGRNLGENETGLSGEHPDTQPAFHHGHHGLAPEDVHHNWDATLGCGPRGAIETGGDVLASNLAGTLGNQRTQLAYP